MAKKLYVGNLPYTVSEDDLRELFEKYGEVQSAKVIKDNATGRSKGFGFVEMAADDAAEKAIADLNGSSLKERAIVVNEARPQTDRGGRGGDRGSFRGRKESNRWR